MISAPRFAEPCCSLRAGCLAALLIALFLPGTVLRAAVLFDVNDRTTTPASLVSVPLTTAGFENVNTFQFTLTWDPTVITYNSTADIFGLGAGNFNFDPLRPDRLTVSWDDLGTPASTADGTTLFSVVFNTVGSEGESSSIDFSDDPTTREVTAVVGSVELTPVTFQESPGLVTVVPEPINVALGVFGGVVVATATFRKLRGKFASR